MKIGMLTSGGDCQGLNAALRGVAKTLYNAAPDVEIVGIQDGYRGLIEADWRKMEPCEFSGILRQGGTILGSSRQPFKQMQAEEEDGTTKLSKMLRNYEKGKFDALAILGGNGTHKTAHLLSENGVNVVTLPKTIDNDIYGTELTFGFDSAVDKAAYVIDSIHTTAASHDRIFVVELMGHKVGWVALYAGIASGADVILIPEIPYDVNCIENALRRRQEQGKSFSIIAVAEGAYPASQVEMTKKERKLIGLSAGEQVAKVMTTLFGQDIRVTVPGHFQRGGDPTATDRVLCSRLGAAAGELILEKKFGVMVALKNNAIVTVPLKKVVSRLKEIPMDSEILHQARLLGISFGDS
ncbi:6-phosphofructokinase [Clostridia bacterium OttesenSCG-928-F22]|nr:6-phosphofructokinase [Clostridia bacterium OttesenSCG-928-F22]